MRISKGFIVICVLALAGYAWYQHHKVDADISESGFVDVGEVEGVDSHFITVVGPT